MGHTIRIAIAGYGNLGRGVETALAQNPDMELVGIFSRRPPDTVAAQASTSAVYPLARIDEFDDMIDVVIACGGSKSDLPQQGPLLAARFNTVDSFDTHAQIPKYFAAVDAAARASGHVAIISGGWDPGLFSLARLYGEAVLPQGATYTFWGKGVSQGHSDAVRRIAGVAAAVQYTIPVEAAMEQARGPGQPELGTREKHVRECFVVLADGADAKTVEQAIVTMPDYFADYDTTVHFVSAQELARDHGTMPHGGFVIRSGTSAHGAAQSMEFSLRLASNPEFTSSVLVACARAAHRLARGGAAGAQTLFDIPPALLSPKDPAQLRRELL